MVPVKTFRKYAKIGSLITIKAPSLKNNLVLSYRTLPEFFNATILSKNRSNKHWATFPSPEELNNSMVVDIWPPDALEPILLQVLANSKIWWIRNEDATIIKESMPHECDKQK